ncbi:trefoil factor 3-like [Ahaetulla prasina]|uniref:trefoil factor 3-like n=1 Tax=Ahaetulla prasina TaxID=499056 RepID=UPI002647D764|nr:trefoil factor 3-like [Ahaetulla prasina]
MNCKWLWFLAIALIFGFSSLTDARIPIRPRPPPRKPPRKGGNCNVPPRSRRDCGYPGISKKTCLSRGCCFDSRYRNAKWCFYRKSCIVNFLLYLTVPEQCQVQPNARVNCGYPYISAQECYNRGCCFDSSVVGVIWCFFPRHEPECSI